MAVQHVNRRGDTYHLHLGKTKTGKPRWFFSTKPEGELAKSIPEGYEVYENPNAQVFLRKKTPRLITEDEVAVVERGVRELAGQKYFAVDVKGESIIVHLPNSDRAGLEDRLLSRFGFAYSAALAAEADKSLSYSPMMKFDLVDDERRTFCAYRWCFRGSIDDWFPLSGSGDLSKMVRKYAPHLGKDSFFELM
jgi:hypothetical protein